MWCSTMSSSALQFGMAQRHQMKRYTVEYRGGPIGSTNLEFLFTPSRRAAGWFDPTPAFEEVRGVFRLYELARTDAGMLRWYLGARDALGLRLLDAGVPLAAQIDLIMQWEDGRYVIHISTDDPRFWR